MDDKTIAKRVVARFQGRQWPELGLWAKSRKTPGGVMVTFEGETIKHRQLLERLGAKWSPHTRAWEMPEAKAQRAFLTLTQTVRQLRASRLQLPADFSYVGPNVRC